MGPDRIAPGSVAVLLIAAALTTACQRSAAPADGGTTVDSASPLPSPVDGRIRYAPDRQPVFVAPDGSRRRIASLLAIPRTMAFGDYVWNDAPRRDPVRSDGARRTGMIWVRVDLARQLISVFRGADEIGTAVIIYGTDGKATPSGTFPLLGRERMHRSSLYDADMPYTLWLTHDGVAIHASSVERGRATHGCIGIPAGFASKLFDVARRGDIVTVLPARDTEDRPYHPL